MSKMTFWALLALLLIMNTIPLGEQTNRRLNTLIAKDSDLTRLDFVLHLFSFLALSFPFIMAQRRKRYVFRSKEISKYASISIACAFAFEMIQLALPYRTFNPKDLVFNLIGAALGIVIVITADATRGIKKLR
ncbi:MAG TPA: VanZ family protein [Candidatus Syntrophosphaera sp.]|nr:VanZ family protein [Candidatus Syntrophosphaera sp.]